MTRLEAAEYLRVKPMTISSWGWEGKITPYKTGRMVRYSRAEIESLLQPANGMEAEPE